MEFATGIGIAAGEGLGALFYLHQPSDGTTYPMLTGTVAYVNLNDVFYGGAFMAMRNTVIAVDRVQFLFDSGNIASGRMTVWGIAHA